MKQDQKNEIKESAVPICKVCGVRTYLTSFYFIKGSHKKHKRGDHKLIYRCPNCHRYVNVHKGTNKPMGFPGDKELRLWRIYTHEVFDDLWRKSGNRKKAYTWLARQMNIPVKDCHIGNFDSEDCKRAIELCIREMARVPGK